jgi:light-regulated signal transduction histidine kinase (bacteriophytochrome)
VICFTEILKQEGKLVQTDEEMLSRILESSKRMDELLTDLLSLSRVSRDDMRLEPTDLSVLAREVVAGLQRAEPDRQIDIAITPGLTAQVDPRFLRIALENLLGNAWKFTRRCPRARIEFSARSDAGRMVYCVRDNGAGFDMAHAAQLFGVFHRLHSDRDFPGTGIGLVIVQRIINRHGGQVWAEGAVNEGASFCFILPADPASAVSSVMPET